MSVNMPINRSEAFVDLSAELLSRGHRVRFRPTGNSMTPTIRDGEAVTVAPVQPSAIKRGDILLYLTRRGVTAHRVVKISKSKRETHALILRGDAPGSSVESVRLDQVLGKIISVERDGRNIDLTSRKAKSMRAAQPRARAENELILCAARVSLDQGARERIKALAKEVTDWRYLIRTANQHGLAPLLCLHLESVCPDRVPEESLKEIRDAFRKNAISNLLLTREMLGLLDLFEAEQIPAIPFKGPALAAAVYKDIALRQFGDLDFLIPKRDVLRAKRLLVGLGYRPEYDLSESEEAAYLNSQSEHGLKGRAYVELQWEIVPRNYSFTINDDYLWQHQRRIVIEGVRVPHLSAEDLLMILAAHGTKERWRRLRWITDIAELIAQDRELDWERACNRARRLGGERMLLLAVALANKILGAGLPEAILLRIDKDRAVKRLASKVRERLFDESHRSELLTAGLFYLSARERTADRLRYCLRMATGPTVKDTTFLRLPRGLSLFYYPLRPARLVGKYGLRALKGFFSQER
jgi:hypothetical protein